MRPELRGSWRLDLRLHFLALLLQRHIQLGRCGLVGSCNLLASSPSSSWLRVALFLEEDENLQRNRIVIVVISEHLGCRVDLCGRGLSSRKVMRVGGGSVEVVNCRCICARQHTLMKLQMAEIRLP
jgi:hypothetical protein